MPRPRTGTISLTTNGRYQLRLPDSAGVRKSAGIFDTRAEAEKERLDALALLREECDDGDRSLGRYGKRWLEERDRAKVVRSGAENVQRWKLHVIGDKIARISLPALREHHVEDWVARMMAKGLASQTVRNVLYLISGVVRSARKRRHVKTERRPRCPAAPERPRTRETDGPT